MEERTACRKWRYCQLIILKEQRFSTESAWTGAKSAQSVSCLPGSLPFSIKLDYPSVNLTNLRSCSMTNVAEDYLLRVAAVRTA